ncbi:acyltransferase [Geodermatophilus sp. DSM 44513]|uniref:acyltransferase n=1 Tax=Geodermatophilus sp. DSM 44513 TaxID=1528104 RepID=UPI0037BF0FB5
MSHDGSCVRRIGSATRLHARRYIRSLWRDIWINRIAASSLIPNHLRFILLQLMGIQASPCVVAPRVWLGGRSISIGRGAYVNMGCVFDSSAPITIGDRVHVGMQVMFVTSSHEIAGPLQRAGSLTSAPIVVEAGAWIGTRATLMPGVRVGEGAIVGAGALVDRDVPPRCLVAGVPARVLKRLADGRL